MRTARWWITLTLIVVVLIGSACGPPKVDWELAVDGAVETPLTLSFADLAKMPQTEVNGAPMQGAGGEEAVTSWRGVALTEIFERAGAGTPAGITAAGDDGYTVEARAEELQDAIVALKQDGKWIQKADPEHGPIRLVTPKTPTNRWVFQLVEIQVQ